MVDLDTQQNFTNPLIHINEDEIMIEWWNKDGSRKLTVFANVTEIDYLKVTKENTTDNKPLSGVTMEDDTISASEFNTLWQWLLKGE